MSGAELKRYLSILYYKSFDFFSFKIFLFDQVHKMYWLLYAYCSIGLKKSIYNMACLENGNGVPGSLE